ncbi:uncharacterized protein LOC141917624 [Strix aluco]|uniref:uncharacterized protein LOC141917624 n=1 Tax=Strix aluco TaxID=111821 RepID=UPI003DA4FD07
MSLLCFELSRQPNTMQPVAHPPPHPGNGEGIKGDPLYSLCLSLLPTWCQSPPTLSAPTVTIPEMRENPPPSQLPLLYIPSMTSHDMKYFIGQSRLGLQHGCFAIHKLGCGEEGGRQTEDPHDKNPFWLCACMVPHQDGIESTELSETKPNLRILEWIFLPFQPRNTVVTRPELFSQLVIKGRQRISDISGIEPEVIYIPVSQFYLDWLLSASTVFQIAIADFLGTITNSYPSDKLLSLLCHQRFVHLPLRSEVPVEGITVFTDAGRKSRRAAVTWKEGDTWEHQLLPGVPGDSLQTLELRAVIWTFQRWSQEPLNIVSDSLYVILASDGYRVDGCGPGKGKSGRTTQSTRLTHRS